MAEIRGCNILSHSCQTFNLTSASLNFLGRGKKLQPNCLRERGAAHFVFTLKLPVTRFCVKEHPRALLTII